MPIDLVNVDSVIGFPASGAPLSSKPVFWQVSGRDAYHHFVKYSTNNAWKAALCDTASKKQKPVTVEWQQTDRYGESIVNVYCEDEP